MTQPSTILYAEDEENDVLFLDLALKRTGLPHLLKSVPDGQQAIEYLAGNVPFADRQLCPLPSIVLLDINMPKKSGFQVLEWIRQQSRFKSLPVLMLTSAVRPEDRRKASQLGADDYFIKPAAPRMLDALVQSLHHRWLSPQPPPPSPSIIQSLP